MSLERQQAVRFLYREEETSGRGKRLRPVVLVSTLGIALGVSLILLSLFVVRGFKSEIRRKVSALVGDVRISNPENSYDQYSLPLRVSEGLISELLVTAKAIDKSAYVSSFSQQMALLKSDSAYHGVLMLGRNEWGGENPQLFSELSSYLVAGNMPEKGSDGVALSQYLAQKLGITIGDDLTAYFSLNDQLRVRKYSIVGLFETGFDDYDHHLVLLDQASLQSVAGWSEDEVGGLSVHLPRKWRSSQELYDVTFDLLADRSEKLGERYALFTCEELNYHLFGWLELLDANVLLILALMIAVAGMTIITGIIVLVLEKVPVIATLKALGQRDHSLKKTFRLMAGHILIRGLLLGNMIVLLLSWIQETWHVISLDSSQYFMNFVPVEVDAIVLVVTNLCVFLVVYLFVLIPTSLIAKVRPATSLRFE